MEGFYFGIVIQLGLQLFTSDVVIIKSLRTRYFYILRLFCGDLK